MSRKSIFIFALVFILTLLSTSLFFLWLPRQSRLTCTFFRGVYPQSDCGLLLNSRDQTDHAVIGVVKSKYQQNGSYFLEVTTKNMKGHQITETFAFPPRFLRMSLVKLTPRNQLKPGGTIQESKKTPQENIFNLLKPNDQIILHILTPSKEEISDAKGKLGNIKYVRCFAYHSAFITYLEKPSLLNFLKLKYLKLTTGCQITILQIAQSP